MNEYTKISLAGVSFNLENDAYSLLEEYLEELSTYYGKEKDGKEIPKIHPAQKPVKLLKRLIEIFTDPGDVVIDPCFGSGSTARAAVELGRNFYGFEINKEFYRRAKEEMLKFPDEQQLSIFDI